MSVKGKNSPASSIGTTLNISCFTKRWGRGQSKRSRSCSPFTSILHDNIILKIVLMSPFEIYYSQSPISLPFNFQFLQWNVYSRMHASILIRHRSFDFFSVFIFLFPVLFCIGCDWWICFVFELNCNSIVSCPNEKKSK